MFSKLIQNYSLIPNQQQKQLLIKQTLNQIKSQNINLIQQQLSIQYDKTCHILQNHPFITVEFIFEKLNVESCIEFMLFSQKYEKIQNQISNKKSNQLIKLLNDIGKHIQYNNSRQYIEWFSKMYTKYSSIEKVIIFMKQMTSNYLQKMHEQFLPQFFADFINSSRIIIEAFLKLKAQAPKFDYDYMQHGQIIVNKTEIWIKEFYIEMLTKLKIIDKKSPLQIAIINAIGDIIGAVMQVQRQGNIKFEVCSQILNQCYNYFKKITCLQQFNGLYLRYLQKNGYNIPAHKIMIPASYPSNIITIPKQSYGFIVFKYLKDSQYFYSNQIIINYLIPIINQLAQFQYELKSQIQQMFIDKIQLCKLKDCFQGGFPLSILYFNVWHFQQKRNKSILSSIDKIFTNFKLTNPKIFVNNLKILTCLHIENLDNEITQFIGIKALQVASDNSQLLINLIKNVQWTNMNDKGQKIWSQVISLMCKQGQIKIKLQRLFQRKQTKNPFETKIINIIQA